MIPWRIRNSCLRGPILCKKTPKAAWFLEQISNSPQNCWPIMIKTSAHEAMNDPISPWTLNSWLVVSTSSRKSWQDRLLDSALSLQSLVTPIPWHPGKYPLCILVHPCASLCILVQPEFPSGISWNWFRSSFNLWGAEDSDFLVQIQWGSQVIWQKGVPCTFCWIKIGDLCQKSQSCKKWTVNNVCPQCSNDFT